MPSAIPSFSTVAGAVDNLLAGEIEVTEDGTVLSGEAAVLRGQLMGLVSRVTDGVVTPGGSNTGNGTPTAATLGTKTKLGTYTLTCIAANTDLGDFMVEDPDGNRVGNILLVGTAFASDHINLTIADGATDFVVGDSFTVVVTVGSAKKYRVYNAANVDGSQYPMAILAEDTDASAADVSGVALYLAGQFKDSGVTGYVEALKETLRVAGIFIKKG